MEPPLLPNPPISTTITTPQQPPPPPQQTSLDSNNSSSWDDQSQQPSQQQKIRLMCSYGGHIIPRPHDKSLCYVGGDTRIFVTNRNTSLTELSARLSKNLLSNRPFWLKYQLPNEDLDSLISVTTDEDLENMIDEYERVAKSSRIRVFLFTSHEFDNSAVSSIGSLLQSSTKSEDWFVHALNNGAAAAANSASTTTNKVFSESSSVNCLLGLDDDVGKLDGSFGGAKNVQINPQDVQSVPDSPMVETASSFGSTNSTPSMTNLPPIKVHVEENNNNNQRVGIEEQFSQLGVKTVTSPVVPVTGTVFSGVPVVVGGGDYVNRVYSDDERSDQGVGVGYRNNNTVQMQQQQLQQQPQQLQPKPIVVPSDLPSPNSVSSESSVTNPLSGQRHFFYQEQGVQIQSGNNRISPNSIEMKHHSDPNNRAQVQQQQVQEAAGYALPVQYDQQQQQQMYHQPQQQYVHASQYIHHTPSGPVPMASYYPIYHSQQQQQQQQQQTHPHQHPGLEQHQYPVYFVHSRQPSQAYNLPVQQTNYSESAQTIASNQPQTPPASSMARNAPASKPEMTAGTYRTAAAAAPQLVQIPPGQHQHQHQHQQQYVGYSQIHHPSQPIPPTSAATANYAYEQIYYSQAHAPQFSAQYQTMTSHNNSSQLPTENNQPTS
ncbi:uncharacterized protein LOC132059928 [Lycium ferocissimum]|uniref:uncharacterized protein LOC132059928 n=1 Tax=Lycium ferocissimum TaxID=112874 RepID=UPI002815D4B6|nr:uncharacterized protein LOC132059928 [Lycium ferocissimum]